MTFNLLIAVNIEREATSQSAADDIGRELATEIANALEDFSNAETQFIAATEGN